MNPNNPPTSPSQSEQPPVPPVQPAYTAQPQPYPSQEPQYAPPQPQPMPQPQYAPVQPVVQQVPAAADPGKVMSIVGLVLAFIFPPAGLSLSIVGYKKSKRVGANTTVAIVGIILNSVLLASSLLMVLITAIAFNGVQDRAMTSNAAVAAHDVTQAAEVYNMETADLSAEQPSPRYPQSFEALSFSSDRPVLATASMAKAPAQPKTVEFYACGDQTGNKIGYWDYAESKVRYEFAGSANESSQDCTLVTQ